MKNKLLLTIILSAIAVLSFGAVSTSAATSVYYTYTVTNDEATITDVNTAIRGNITIPSSLGGYPVTTIDFAAFNGCSGLTNITVPDSITSIGNSAFRGCIRLTGVKIPDSVTSIGIEVFYGCNNLTNIDVDVNNPKFCSIDGNLFNKSKTTLIQYAIGKSDTFYKIPDDVTNIGDSAFYDCIALTSVTIPDSVTFIGNSAFEFCSGLTSITIPNSVTDIGNSAFSRCSGLTSVTIGENLTNIGKLAFYNCYGLENIRIGENITSIKEKAFYGCYNILDVYYNGTKDEWSKISIENSNSCLTNAKIRCIPRTETTVSDNGKSFLIKPVGVEGGKTIILALYDGNTFVEMQSKTYNGSDLSFTTKYSYTKAKVMVWEDLINITPICDAEIIE